MKLTRDLHVTEKQTRQPRRSTRVDPDEKKQRPYRDEGRRGLLILEGGGAQVRTIKGRPDNETQVKEITRRQKRRGNRNRK